MVSEEIIKDKLKQIFLTRSSINFEENEILKEEKLLGSNILLPVRELILILYDIEKDFSINIPKEIVLNGKFDSYNHIVEIVLAQVI